MSGPVCASHGVGVVAVSVVLVGLGAAATAQPQWESLTLPPGVGGKADIFMESESSPTPDQKYEFAVHREWVRTEQFLPEGSFGWALFDFTLDTFTQSVIYNTRSRRGMRMHRLSILGNSRAENLFSPMCWVRMLHVREAAGAEIAVDRTGALTVYSAEQAQGQGRFRVFVDSTGRVVRAQTLRPNSDEMNGEFVYGDWRVVGDIGEHPYETSVTLSPEVGQPLQVIARVTELHGLDVTAEPPGYTLPPDAVITDYIDSVTRDGTGHTVGGLPEDPVGSVSAATGGWLNSRVLAMTGGVLLVGAAVVWEVRRRRT